MDKNLPLHRADMLVHLYAEKDRFADRGKYLVFPISKGKLKNLYIKGKKYYDYSKVPAAMRDKFNNFFPFSDKEYEERKQEAIHNYFEKPKKETFTSIKGQRDSGMKWIYNVLKLTQEEIAEGFGVSQQTVHRALAKEDLQQ